MENGTVVPSHTLVEKRWKYFECFLCFYPENGDSRSLYQTVWHHIPDDSNVQIHCHGTSNLCSFVLFPVMQLTAISPLFIERTGDEDSYSSSVPFSTLPSSFLFFCLSLPLYFSLSPSSPPMLLVSQDASQLCCRQCSYCLWRIKISG